MKAKILGLFILTLAVIGGGSFSLITSITQMKASVQKELSDEMLISMPKDTEVVENISLPSGEDEDIILLKRGIYICDFNRYAFFYEGCRVRVRDTLMDESASMKNAEKIMDFIYHYVDETILKPCGIDKSEYQYIIKREDKVDAVSYGVFLEAKNGETAYAIGVGMDNGEPVLHSFSKRYLVYSTTSAYSDVSLEFLECNWSETTEKREGIYAKYLEKSKKMIAALGLPPIVEEIKDVDSLSYFHVFEDSSTIGFGYVLEDGTYIRVFYNRVNETWIGFCIWGYYEGDMAA